MRKGVLVMSHELEDNIERRKLIVQSMPLEGLYEHEFIQHIMEFGYNSRGARQKMRELLYLKTVTIKGNKYYPIKTVTRTRARARAERDTHTHEGGDKVES
jgi:hypothetical protein